MSEPIRTKVRAFLVERFPAMAARKVGDSDSLLDSGIIDSLGILDLATFVEREFGVTLTDEELVPENFDSLDALSSFLDRKKSA